MKILFVEDSPRLQRSVGSALKKAGYAVDVSGDGEDGLWRAETYDYDVIVLDLMLPKLDGLTVLRRLRAGGRDTHILLLTARDTIEDRVLGLSVGADDYLVKPFALEELLARVQTLCRRSYGKKTSLLVFDDLEIDSTKKSVRRAGQPIDLTAREFMLLQYLATRAGEVVSRTEIEAHIYDHMVDPMSNVVDSAICALRKKIALPRSRPLIHTRRGLGYVIAVSGR